MKRVLKFFYILTGLLFTTIIATGNENEDDHLKNAGNKVTPEGQWDFLIIIAAVIIVVFTLIFSIKYLVKPGEKSPDHIKNIVIDNY